MNADLLPTSPARDSAARNDRDVRSAWVCLAASPLAFVLAFVVGEGISSALGHQGDRVAPWWIATVTLVVSVAVFCVPAVLATRFWRRAAARGDTRAMVPAVILITVSTAFLGLNLAAYLVGLFLEKL